eukprot:1430250-Amphidinium_carterae.1
MYEVFWQVEEVVEHMHLQFSNITWPMGKWFRMHRGLQHASGRSRELRGSRAALPLELLGRKASTAVLLLCTLLEQFVRGLGAYKYLVEVIDTHVHGTGVGLTSLVHTAYHGVCVQ